MSGSSSSSREAAVVRMFEMVTASHWTARSSESNVVDDLRPLLLMMDIGSCASAEKHTRVNCVTASMGDVVIEHYPRIGELLELRAAPVSVGRTSLDISVLVVAHGCNESNGSAETKQVCEAFFTYVTTRGPDGEKRFAPPLAAGEGTGSYACEKTWERTMAQFRKQLIRSEQVLVKRHTNHLLEEQRSGGNDTAPSALAIFECSEVVLPRHQNHMEHLFGGIVMGWMCKSALAGCVLACRKPPSAFRIRSIQRVDFPKGADVQDHVVLRPRITAIFDGGRHAEVEVRVTKRSITREQPEPSSGEALMNVGHFYVTGVSSYEQAGSKRRSDIGNTDGGPEEKLSCAVAPFADLLKKRSDLYGSNPKDKPSLDLEMARERLNALLTRMNLLAGIGDSIRWDASMELQAPILTILSVLRLCDDYIEESTSTYSSNGRGVDENNSGPIWTVPDLLLSHNQPNTTVEWARGEESLVGHSNTFLLRGKTVVSRRRPVEPNLSGNGFLEAVYATIRDKRPEWDPACMAIECLERSSDENTEAENGKEALEWAVVEYQMKSAIADFRLCLLQAGAYLRRDGSIAGSGEDDDDDGDSTQEENTSAVLASRSVRHQRSKGTHRVLPSGWVLKTMEDDGEDNDETKTTDERLEITYVAEFDYDTVRQSGALKGHEDYATEELIAGYVGLFVGQWFENLASFYHYRSNDGD